jgi:hypothetical protein
MTKRQQVIALLALGWTFRRIERETGVRRETVSRYARPADPSAAKVFPGSDGPEGVQIGDRDAVWEPNAAEVTAGGSANAAKVLPDSLPSRSAAGVYHEAAEKLNAGLSAQRIWQDLVEDFGYGHSYESVKRYVRRLEPAGGSCRTCGRANGRAPTRSLDASKRTPAPTATTGRGGGRSLLRWSACFD